MGGRVKDGLQEARSIGRPNGALLGGRCCGGRGEFHTYPPYMYAEDVGAAASRRRPVRSGFSPVVSRRVRRKPKISLQSKRGGRVKGGRQSANSTHLRRICTPHLREPPLRGGALLGRGAPQLYIRGFGGSRKSLYKQNGGSSIGRASCGATQRPAEWRRRRRFAAAHC